MKLLMIAALATFVGFTGFAGFAAIPQEKASKREPKDRIEMAGTVVCIGCTLEKQPGGADAQCTLHAKHAQGLLAADGTLWTFVDNAKGHLAITNEKLRGKEVKLLCWKFPKAQYVELSKYQA